MNPGRAMILVVAWLLGTVTAHAMDIAAPRSNDALHGGHAQHSSDARQSDDALQFSDAPRWRPDSTFVQFGGGSSTDEWTFGVQWNWQREWQLGENWRIRGRWEVEFGRLRALTRWNRDDDAWYTKIGIIPTVRFTGTRLQRWYVDAGVGPTLLLPLYVDRERTFSTAFNFDDYIALGVMLGDRRQHDLSIGLNHISNAGVDQPNPGLNLFSLRYTHRF